MIGIFQEIDIGDQQFLFGNLKAQKHEWCIGSIEELYELNKDFWQIEKKDNKYFYTSTWKEIDLHKHFVDDAKIQQSTSWVELKRIPEVLDCWFRIRFYALCFKTLYFWK